MTSLNDQLADIFSAGLDAKPELRASLAEALSQYSDSDSKSTKSESNYRKSEDSSNGNGNGKGNEKERCGECVHFSNNSCEIVAGKISPDYVCDYYKPAGKRKD